MSQLLSVWLLPSLEFSLMVAVLFLQPLAQQRGHLLAFCSS